MRRRGNYRDSAMGEDGPGLCRGFGISSGHTRTYHNTDTYDTSTRPINDNNSASSPNTTATTTIRDQTNTH